MKTIKQDLGGGVYRLTVYAHSETLRVKKGTLKRSAVVMLKGDQLTVIRGSLIESPKEIHKRLIAA